MAEAQSAYSGVQNTIMQRSKFAVTLHSILLVLGACSECKPFDHSRNMPFSRVQVVIELSGRVIRSPFWEDFHPRDVCRGEVCQISSLRTLVFIIRADIDRFVDRILRHKLLLTNSASE